MWVSDVFGIPTDDALLVIAVAVSCFFGAFWGVRSAMPASVEVLKRRLSAIDDTSRTLARNLRSVDWQVRAEARAGTVLSTSQTAFGTLVGVLAGVGSNWMFENPVRGIVSVLGGLALVIAGPKIVELAFIALWPEPRNQEEPSPPG
jgi:hypothetical protein